MILDVVPLLPPWDFFGTYKDRGSRIVGIFSTFVFIKLWIGATSVFVIICYFMDFGGAIKDPYADRDGLIMELYYVFNKGLGMSTCFPLKPD